MDFSESLVSQPQTKTSTPSTGSVLSFSHLSYGVSLGKAEGTKLLVDDVSVQINAGELLAIMGPSGAGKSTLLDLMAFRKQPMDGASATLNGQPLDAGSMHKISMFVEQEDALLGVLTVRESISYALRLHLPLLSRKEVGDRVNRVLTALGLQSCADQRIGTAISRGISGGQKRRVTAACAMVTYPRILLLDEVTSGLDNTSAREVVSAIRSLAISEGIIVLATIHQPSLDTISQFTNVLFLGEGKVCFSGRVDELEGFFEQWGRPVRKFHTPAEHAMNFLNREFSDVKEGYSSIDEMRSFYLSIAPKSHASSSNGVAVVEVSAGVEYRRAGAVATLVWNTLVLAERSGLNYSRNLLAYGVRLAMYAGMGLMLATARFGFALEIRIQSSTIVFRFISLVWYSYALCLSLVSPAGLHPGGDAFFRFLGFLFLAILTAESQILVVAALLPIFIAALVVGAGMNGLWHQSAIPPRFWFYSFHYIDYQRYAFELLANSDFRGLTFKCNTIINGACACAYPTSTPETCTVSGADVLKYLDIGSISYGKWAAILFSINIIYRIALFFVLKRAT
ncbi:P-loop containing nucleoside triphosphate hydrolase protein [Infundibulicybe gibba]|nr:P-loop containing nucleoside triphosphate hydrolase protein [Infundibulicybe gibba]